MLLYAFSPVVFCIFDRVMYIYMHYCQLLFFFSQTLFEFIHSLLSRVTPAADCTLMSIQSGGMFVILYDAKQHHTSTSFKVHLLFTKLRPVTKLEAFTTKLNTQDSHNFFKKYSLLFNILGVPIYNIEFKVTCRGYVTGQGHDIGLLLPNG